MNIDKLLKQWGYGGHPEYKAIINYSLQLKNSINRKREYELTEEELREAVSIMFPINMKINMFDKPAPYKLWTHDNLPVDGNAIDQLKTALKLPVAIGGAGMPDLHKGYSLPIGGVVALDNAVSPAFVGYDISCMVQLTAFNWRSDMTPADLDYDEDARKRMLEWILASTSFGLGSELPYKVEHPVMDDPLWDEIRFLRNLKDLAWRQLGSSGAGNHFCDSVVAYQNGVNDDGELVGVDWIGLMTHSGSRGVGNKVGHYYSKIADELTRNEYSVPEGYGWFNIHSDLGQEYLAVMRLMGDYAQANHTIIHSRFTEVSGLVPDRAYISKHNFAWVSDYGVVLHRKGATPAYKNQYGVIPGSSGSSSFLVLGKGNEESWNSASHGAGRPFSRSEAKRRFDSKKFEAHMDSYGILYHGVAADEAVSAYKDINMVMQAQRDLVEVVAVLEPKVVVMGGHTPSDDGD